MIRAALATPDSGSAERSAASGGQLQRDGRTSKRCYELSGQMPGKRQLCGTAGTGQGDGFVILPMRALQRTVMFNKPRSKESIGMTL